MLSFHEMVFWLIILAIVFGIIAIMVNIWFLVTGRSRKYSTLAIKRVWGPKTLEASHGSVLRSEPNASVETFTPNIIQALVGELSMIKDKSIYTGHESSYSVSQLIEDIKARNPRGLEHLKLWYQANHTLKTIGVK